VSTQRNPIDQALDLFVFAPLGATIEFWEKMPELAQLGRDRLGAQAPAARMIGEFAVKTGRKKVEAGIDSFANTGRKFAGAQVDPDNTVEPGEAAQQDPAPSAPAPDDSDLAIDDYDGLPAVQIIPALANISAVERDLIRAHETAGRGRRTILGKLDQLDARDKS